MPLTKKDLTQIKGRVYGVTHNEVENLARIVARGFGAVDKRSDTHKHFVYRDEF